MFSDLPDDLVFLIADLLTPEPQQTKKTPYHYRHHELVAYNNYYVRASRDMAHLAQVNKRIYHIVRPLLYRRMTVPPRQSGGFRPPQEMTTFIKSTMNEAKTTMQPWIREVHLMFDFQITTDMFSVLFFLPNIRTISASGWACTESSDLPGMHEPKTSPVTTLHLLDCGAMAEPLRQVLSWPKSLETFTINVELNKWEVENSIDEWSNDALVSALDPIAQNVKDLTITRYRPIDVGPYCRSTANLRSFTNLTSLKINQAFIIFGWNLRPHDLHSRLPDSLEELEIYYDDYGSNAANDFLSDGHGLDESYVRFAEAKTKGKAMSAFRRLRIISQEYDPGNDSEAEEENEAEEDENGDENDDEPDDTTSPRTRPGAGNNATIGAAGTYMEGVSYVGRPTWQPPREFVEAYKAANISFSVFLSPQRRWMWRAQGDEQGFEVQWEDDWEDDTYP